MEFIITDWAGNVIGNERFAGFEDAWEFIYGELTDRLGLTEEDYQEYYVVRAETRPSRYLEPRHPLAGQRKAKS